MHWEGYINASLEGNHRKTRHDRSFFGWITEGRSILRGLLLQRLGAGFGEYKHPVQLLYFHRAPVPSSLRFGGWTARAILKVIGSQGAHMSPMDHGVKYLGSICLTCPHLCPPVGSLAGGRIPWRPWGYSWDVGFSKSGQHVGTKTWNGDPCHAPPLESHHWRTYSKSTPSP